MIAIRTETELDLIRRSAEILKICFERIEAALRPGVTTAELNRIAEEFITSRDAAPAFKGYQGYPASICASVNEQVVHGIPGPRKLEEGDIVGIDVGVQCGGWGRVIVEARVMDREEAAALHGADL